MQTAHKFERQITKQCRLQYLLFLPKGYDPKAAKKWPLIFFLHGAGERGTDVRKVATHGVAKIVQDRPEFPFIVLSPQCPDGEWWSKDVLMALLDEITSHYAVDVKRVYLTGLSMGGFGTWHLAMSYPEKFAAIAPVCGGGEPIDVYLAGKARMDLIKSLGVWAFHGAKDSVVKLKQSEEMVESLREIGCREVKFTVYPEAEHDSWTETYNNPELYEWFLKHSR